MAFILAMAAEASGAAWPDPYDATKPLQAGDLRKLLEATVDANDDAKSFLTSGDRRLPGDKTAQFFPNFPNFFSCNAGNWRKC